MSVNILCDVIPAMFDFLKRDLCTQDHNLYQNASKNQIYFSQVICPGYTLSRIWLNVQHIIAMEDESAYSPYSKTQSYAGMRAVS